MNFGTLPLFARPFQHFTSRVNTRYEWDRSGPIGVISKFRRQKRAVSVRSFRPPGCFCNIKTKYVNMADINVSDKASAKTSVADRRAAMAGPAEPIWDIIELLFF